MPPTKYCPECVKQNKQTKLILRQINFRLAVYLCEDKSCPYPEGYGFQVEPRTLSELAQQNKESLHEESDLDTWLDKFFAEEGNGHSASSNAQIEDGNINDEDGNINDEDLASIIDEISNTLDEYESDLKYDTDIFSWIDNAFLPTPQGQKEQEKEEHQHNTIENDVQNKDKTCEDVDKITNNVKSINLNEQINHSTATISKESSVNDNNRELDGTEFVINKNQPKLCLKSNDAQENKDTCSPVQYRVLNFEQCHTPINDGSKPEIRKVQPIKTMNKASGKKSLNKKKANQNYVAKVKSVTYKKDLSRKTVQDEI